MSWFLNIWNGNNTILGPSSAVPSSTARFQVTGHFKVPLQCPQVSLDEHGQEQIQVGFNLAHGTEILHQSTWGFVEEVVVLTPSKVGQFAQGWKGHKSITRSSYYVVATFSGDNKHAMDLLENAVKAWAMH